MILVLKFSNSDSGTVLVVQQLRLHIPKHRMFGSTHGLRTKITHALEQLRVDTAKKKKKEPTFLLKEICSPFSIYIFIFHPSVFNPNSFFLLTFWLLPMYSSLWPIFIYLTTFYNIIFSSVSQKDYRPLEESL